MESIVTVLRSSLPCVPTTNSPSGKLDAPAKSTNSVNLNDAVVDQAADALMAAAKLAEPEITTLLQAVASANGGKLDGLDFKFKGKASMQRTATSPRAERTSHQVGQSIPPRRTR